jgi:MFS family permease
MTSQHPLDRDDSDETEGFDFSSPQSGLTAGPEKRLLKLCVRAIIGFGVLVALSSVAVNNIKYGSAEYQIAFGINRLLMFLLLLAFAGVLLAYQLPNLRLKLIPMNIQPSKSNVVTRSLDRPSNPIGPIGPIGLLTVISLITLVVAWLAAFLLSTVNGPIASFLFTTVTGVVPGVLITMIVWNKGCVRAYAIGAITTYLLSAFVFFQQAMFFSRMGIGMNQSMGGGGNSSIGYIMGIQWSTIILGGMLAALYVWLLEKFGQKPEDSPPSEQFSWKPSNESNIGGNSQ